MKPPFLALLVLLLPACAASGAKPTRAPVLPPGAEALSLAGEALFPPPIKPEVAEQRERELAEARAKWEANPGDLDAAIWVGRRLGYLGRYNEAVDVFSQAIARHPKDPRPYRHRGHRYISLRLFDLAVRDLSMAAELAADLPDEPELPGLPNDRGLVLDTLKQSIHYHLALAHYLEKDFPRALVHWRECRKHSGNPDALVSVTYWTWLTLRRLGRVDEAKALLEPIKADLDIVENHAYFRLCLAFKGERDPDALLAEARSGDVIAVDYPTTGYGVGTWHFVEGRKARAMEVWGEVAKAPMWAAFGRIASEAELY